MNTFINLVKRFLIKKRTKNKKKAFKKMRVLVEILLLLILNFLTKLKLASFSYFLIRLTSKLIKKLHKTQDFRAIAIEI